MQFLLRYPWPEGCTVYKVRTSFHYAIHSNGGNEHEYYITLLLSMHTVLLYSYFSVLSMIFMHLLLETLYNHQYSWENNYHTIV